MGCPFHPAEMSRKVTGHPIYPIKREALLPENASRAPRRKRQGGGGELRANRAQQELIYREKKPRPLAGPRAWQSIPGRPQGRAGCERPEIRRDNSMTASVNWGQSIPNLT